MIKYRHMRTFLSKFSKDFEENILNIIGDFAGSYCFIDKRYPICRLRTGDYHRLRFNVTKRRHLGKIFVERVSPRFGVVTRRWLKAAHWHPSYDVHMMMQCRALQNTLRTLNPVVDTKYLHLQIKVCRNACNFDTILVI